MVISEFLIKYPVVKCWVKDAFIYLQDYFPNCHISLEVVIDPESGGDAGETLLLSVYTDMDINAALFELGEFDEAWGLEASRQTNGKFLVDLGFENANN